MRKLFLLFISISVLIACSNDEKFANTSINEASTPLAKFSNFLNSLDSTKAESINAALEYFEVNFEKERDSVCDSAYFVFDELYSKVCQNLEVQIEQDTTDYVSLFYLDKNGKPIPPSSKILAFQNKLKKNGYYLNSDGEGGAYIEYDRDFVNGYFLSKVSQAMKLYLKQISKETYEGFSADAELIISEEQYASRLLFWEKFLGDYPNFFDKKAIENHQKSELTFLFTGVDNTPLMEYDSENTISNYYKTIYELTEKRNPSGNIATTLRPYYQALLNKDTATANKIKKEMQEKGIIENYEY